MAPVQILLVIILAALCLAVVESFNGGIFQRTLLQKKLGFSQKYTKFKLCCKPREEGSSISNPSNPKADAKKDDDDLDEEEIQRELDMHDKISDEELDIDLISESDADRAIEMAIKNVLGPKEPELSPMEKFDKLYKDLKSTNKEEKAKKFNHTDMLATIFSESQKKDPFDERKVMIKLRKMLESEDFEQLFKDPNIGDWL